MKQTHGVMSTTAQQHGFTLIELIMVIVMLGVLAVFAGPRLLSTSSFSAMGFHDETLAYLRYAQKTAVAQRRTVCVGFVGLNQVVLTIASTASTPSCAGVALVGPKGESPATLTAKSGAVFSAAPVNFNFDGLGQPINSAGVPVGPLLFQVEDVGKSITVEAATGYVHD